MTLQPITETEIVALDPTGGRLLSWAQAARAAHELATMLVRTTIVPDVFRVAPGTTGVQADIVTGNAAAAILMGDELGLTPMSALRSLYVVRGKVGTYTEAKVALVKSRGHVIWTEAETDDSVTVAGYRAGDPEHVERVTWTIARARAAGYLRNDQYATNPRTMLYARAAGDVAKRIAPDVLLGIPEDADEPGSGSTAGPTQTVQRRRLQPSPVDDPTPGGESSQGDDAGVGPDHQRTPEDAQSVPTRTGDVDEPDEPDEPTEDTEPLITRPQMNRLQAAFLSVGIRSPERRHGYLTSALGHPVESTSDLTVTEASAMIDRVEAQANPENPPDWADR